MNRNNSKQLSIDEFARLMTAFRCLSEELTQQEQREFKDCFSLTDDIERDTKFKYLMQGFIQRLSASHMPLS